MWKQIVTIEGLYNFDFGLNRLALDPLHIFSLTERKIKLPIYLKKKEVVAVTATGSTERPEFLICGQYEDTKEAVLHEVYRIFQWNQSLHAIHAHFAQTTLAEIFSTHRGTPMVLDFAYYENLYKAIIHRSNYEIFNRLSRHWPMECTEFPYVCFRKNKYFSSDRHRDSTCIEKLIPIR